MIGPGPDTTDMAFFNTQGYLRKGWRGFRGSSTFEKLKSYLPWLRPWAMSELLEDIPKLEMLISEMEIVEKL